MLVLTRRHGEEIVIAGNIHVKVLTGSGKTVRLGITAPSTIPIVRKELLPKPPEGERPRESEPADPNQENPCRSIESAS